MPKRTRQNCAEDAQSDGGVQQLRWGDEHGLGFEKRQHDRGVVPTGS
jgi:hypothetical protein